MTHVRIASARSRALIQDRDGRWLDVESASKGRFGSDVMDLYNNWLAFADWAADGVPTGGIDIDPRSFDAPVTRPRQIFGIGLNYRMHALEAGLPIPEVPLVFTKFPSSVTGPHGEIPLPTGQTDWEVELAVVVGTVGVRVPAEEAWSHVAGVTLAQDISARDVQLTPRGSPQFSLGKSFPSFLPLGPVLVTPDELPDRNAVRLWCSIDGEEVQSGNTDDLIFPVATLIAYLSSVVTLWPGDVILTGTPAGVGIGRDPQRFLQPGQELRTGGAGIGEMNHRTVDDPWVWQS